MTAWAFQATHLNHASRWVTEVAYSAGMTYYWENSPLNHLTVGVMIENHLIAENRCFEVKKRFVPMVPTGLVRGSRDHNACKGSCLHPTHCHNVDIS